MKGKQKACVPGGICLSGGKVNARRVVKRPPPSSRLCKRILALSLHQI